MADEKEKDKGATQSAATATATAEKPKEMMVITLADGTELEVEADGKVAKSIKNLEAEQKAAAFKETREKVEKAITEAINDEAEGFEEALADMSVILNFGDDEGAKLHETSKVTIRQRAKRSDAAS